MNKIKNRLASEQGFTLIELLVVIVILGILVAIAVPAYLSFVGNAKTAASEANVRSAIPAAESYYQDSVLNTTPDTYGGITGTMLREEAPGVSPNVTATPLTNGTLTNSGYCVQDTEPNNVTWSYIGGNPPATITGKAATIEKGTCQAEAGVAAT